MTIGPWKSLEIGEKMEKNEGNWSKMKKNRGKFKTWLFLLLPGQIIFKKWLKNEIGAILKGTVSASCSVL